MITNTSRHHALENQIRRLTRRVQQMEAKRSRFTRYRAPVFLGGLALAFWWGWSPFLLAVLLIGLESVYYARISRVMRRCRLWLDIKRTQQARMTLDWDAIPEPPDYAPSPQHPFGNDLAITGRCSLQHLLDMTISQQGSQRLREWLLQPRPDLERIRTRQAVVRELTPLARFRDKLLLNFYLVSKEQLDSAKLLQWLHAPTASAALRRALPISWGLALVNILLFTGAAFGWLPGYWVFSLSVYLVLYFLHQPAVTQSFDAVMLLYDDLDKCKAILRYLETYPYRDETHLQRLCAPFRQPGARPSAQLRKAVWLTTAVGLRMNPVLAIALNLVLPWDMTCAALIGRYQQRCAACFPEWVNAWTELEALVCLANFAYLYPDYAFPDMLTDDTPTPLFDAVALGHPLIPADQKVCNDFSFQQPGEIALITGSNMAGKSTFLKTVGINLCLAYAGGPVNAATLRTRLLRLFTCIQVHDSITNGLSFFYAEVKRLRQLLEAVHGDDARPVVFLIDEIFRGTNSRERLLGSRAYIHHLAAQRNVGMIATHDLELGQLADQIPGLRNAHFRDEVVDGKMVFDYTLRPGMCATTNAVKIMRMEGLPIAAPKYPE